MPSRSEPVRGSRSISGDRERRWSLSRLIVTIEPLPDGRLKLSTPSDRNDLLDDTRAIYMSPFDGRAYMLLKSKVSDDATFRRLGTPTCLITWRGSSEDNWPVEIADEVEPYRLGVTGRMVTFVLMTVAR